MKQLSVKIGRDTSELCDKRKLIELKCCSYLMAEEQCSKWTGVC